MSISDGESTPARGSITDAVLEIWAEKRARNHLKIAGNSMLPLIKGGDSVLVEHGAAGIRRGDIIVFRYGNDLAAHRVLRIYDDDTGSTFVTKGDSVLQFDPPLSAGEIVGRVLAIKRGGRHMSLDTPVWRVWGWLIAVSTLVGVKLYGWGRTLEQRVVGGGPPQPNRLTALLRRSARALFRLFLKVFQAVFGRWKDSI